MWQHHPFKTKRSKINCARLLLCLMIIMAPLQAVASDAKGAYRDGNYATAFRQWSDAAEAGDAEAQFNLAYMYENGQGVHQDLFAALKWYQLAAGQNYPTSNVMVSSVRRKINAQREQNIQKWLPKADAGDIRSQLALARLLLQNTDDSDNPIEALKWLLLAEQGTQNKTVLARIQRTKAQAIKRMTRQDQAQASNRVRAWKALRKSDN